MKQEKLMNLYATGDQKLNSHIFGNIPLKAIDFRSPEIHKIFKFKKPETKGDIYNHQFEKLSILISFYNE